MRKAVAEHSFRLRFKPERIAYWANRYEYQSDAVMLDEIGPTASSRGFLTRQEFLALCEWNSFIIIILIGTAEVVKVYSSIPIIINIIRTLC